MPGVGGSLDRCKAQPEGVGAAEQDVAIGGVECSRIVHDGGNEGEEPAAVDGSGIADLGSAVTARRKGEAARVLEIGHGKEVARIDVGGRGEEAADIHNCIGTEGDAGWIDDPDMASRRQHALDGGGAEPPCHPVDRDPVAAALVEMNGIAGANVEALPVYKDSLRMLIDRHVHAGAVRDGPYGRCPGPKSGRIADDHGVGRLRRKRTAARHPCDRYRDGKTGPRGPAHVTRPRHLRSSPRWPRYRPLC